MTKISIVLPIRPICPGLIDVISSIKSQTFVDWHIVALLDRDDGRNLELLNRMLDREEFSPIACDYTRIGFPAMLNLGITAAKGELIARVDDDDGQRHQARAWQQGEHRLGDEGQP